VKAMLQNQGGGENDNKVFQIPFGTYDASCNFETELPVGYEISDSEFDNRIDRLREEAQAEIVGIAEYRTNKSKQSEKIGGFVTSFSSGLERQPNFELNYQKLRRITNNLDSARNYKLDSTLFAEKKSVKNIPKTVFSALFNSGFESIDGPCSLSLDDLKNQESLIGAKVFGPLRSGERRLFFYDEVDSWFFYQSIDNTNNTAVSTTLHYEVHPGYILRINTNNGIKCEPIHDQELDNFMRATEVYHNNVMEQMYREYVGRKIIHGDTRDDIYPNQIAA
jgi:hypothetical protein